MRTRYLLFILAAVLLLTLLTVGGQPAAQSLTTLKIGFIEGAGAPGDAGARLAVEQINRIGGITGPDGTQYRLELSYQQRPPTIASDVPIAVNFLTTQGAIALIGPTDNELTLPNLEPLARAGVPVLTLATSDTLTDVDVTNNIMRMRAAERYHSFALADVLLRERGYTRIAIIQTDIESTEALLIFENGMQNLGYAPTLKLQRLDNSTLTEDTAEILQAAPEAVVMWGPHEDAAALLQNLRTANYRGLFVYRDALDAVSAGVIPLRLANGIMGVTSWAYSTPNEISRLFLLDFITAYNRIPTSVDAAAYDAVWILRRQIELTGPEMPQLYEGLLRTPAIVAVQGRLEPVVYGNGDFARHVTVYTIPEAGGPHLVARYADNARLPDSDLINVDEIPRIVGLLGTITFTPSPTFTPSVTPIPTSTFTPIPASPTPAQVSLYVELPTVNVRSGPGTDFDKIGEINQGETHPIIGTNADRSWVVIRFGGGQGWVSAEVVQIFDPYNDFNLLPILQPIEGGAFVPPPVTQPPPPSGGIDLLIESVVLSPAQLSPSQPFSAQVVIRNNGTQDATNFIVAATFQPDNIPVNNTIGGLAAGGIVSTNLVATVSGTGSFTIGVMVDSSNGVAETNESNNVYTLSYRVDYPVVAEVQEFTLPVNTALDLAGGTADILWTGAALNAQNGALLGIIPSVTYDTVFYDSINPTIINQASLTDLQVQQGVLIGVITAEGQRGVMEVDQRFGSSVTVTYRIYRSVP